jgi:hypothetical protein
MMRKALPWIYLLLAVLGAVLPWRANLEFIAESGQTFDLQRFINDANVTAASRSLSADLLIGASAVSLWICTEGIQQKIRGWWVAILMSFGIAFACGAPFFLCLREWQLQGRVQDSDSAS